MMKDDYEERRKKEKIALKKSIDEHHASMAKGFNAVDPSNNQYGEICGPVGEGKPRLYFPNFELNVSDIPEAKTWDVGKRYKVAIVVEMTAMEARKGSEPKVRFDVLGVKADGVVESKEKDEDKDE